ncbi:hypothetical protein D9M68_920080 [compost metagenome]
MAQEERGADLVFERLDLPADGTLCEGQLLGGGAEVQVPRHGVKGAQVAGRDRAGAGMAGGKRHGRVLGIDAITESIAYPHFIGRLDAAAGRWHPC